MYEYDYVKVKTPTKLIEISRLEKYLVMMRYI